MDLKGYLVHLIDITLQDTHVKEMEDFVNEVLESYMRGIYQDTYFIPMHNVQIIKDELKDEIIEVTRIKTYGYYNIEDYQRHKLKKIS